VRTTRQTFTFDRPFSLAAIDQVQPAGTYTVDVNEELIDGCRSSAGRDHRLFVHATRKGRLCAGRQSGTR
jgi:hypothetical protein